MRICVVSALLVLFVSAAQAQTSADWQQRVQYDMEIILHPDNHSLTGTQRLVYFNNSPDTLRVVYYHLYFNAFQPTSMMAERNRQLPDPDPRIAPKIFNLGPEEIGFHEIDELTQHDVPLRFGITDTVLRAELHQPLAPGDSTVLSMRFRSQVPLQTRRSGRDNAEGIAYSMSQWYPKLAHYDATGWHADPYIGREFYAPFGTFDVRLRLPAPYVVGATGILQNPDAIGHGYQTDTTAVFTHADTDTLEWHFIAEQVHDFAWVADTDYLHRKVEGDALTLHFLFQPDVASNWERLIEWTPSLFKGFEDLVGRYRYPQFTVAQAGDGGMEYPMMTFITGRRSVGSLRSVTAHEAAHEWFYGVLGSNEADYAWMDEGFANYMQAETMARMQGQPRGNHLSALYTLVLSREFDFFERSNTPSDWFTTNAAYGMGSYSSGQGLAETMAYVISDSLRDDWLRTYFDRFAFRHPNPWDVQKVAEDVSGLELDWLFEQWTNDEHPLDYAVADVRSDRATQEHTIILRRNTPFVMPVDLLITFEGGATQWVNVPLGIMQGHKPVPEGWLVAAPWLWTFPEYTLTLSGDGVIADVQIDPMVRTPDANRLNNAKRIPRSVQFLEPAAPNWLRYGIGWRPLADYAHDFGPGLGVRAEGGYMLGKHTASAMVKLWPQVILNGNSEDTSIPGDDLSALDGINYAFSYHTPFPLLGRNTEIGVALANHLGLLEHRVQVDRSLQPFGASTNHTLSVAVNHQYSRSDRVFRLDGINWFMDENLLSAVLSYRASHGRDWLGAMLELGTSFRNQLDLECRDAQNRAIPCPFELRQGTTRLVLGGSKSVTRGRVRATADVSLGLGVEDLAFHKRFRLGTPSIESLWRDASARTVLAAFEQPLSDQHLTAFGEPGPVGYAYSVINEVENGRPVGGMPLGTSALGGSLSVSSAVLPGNAWLRPLRVELFSGIGTTWGQSTFAAENESSIPFRTENLIADAGLGVTYELSELSKINRWTNQSEVLSGMNLTAKFPLWLSDPDLINEPDAVAFRWLLGVTLQR